MPALPADLGSRNPLIGLLQHEGDLRHGELQLLYGTLLVPVPGS